MKKFDDDFLNDDEKQKQLDPFKVQNTGPGKEMQSDSGFKISNDETTLRAGRRGPLLIQDTHFYRKQSRFSRERIPEKVVHARGFGLYGEFELYKSMSAYTKAHFLQQPGTKTPVFTRFSNFIGSKGSKDTAIDIRGFAVKFYTQEGNYDMLSLQFPCFLLFDAMKFMDVTHAVKPNQITDVPQATVAQDRFWDYVVSNQETAHMVMWLMSLRGRPRSWRMMEGWPINTFRFINHENESTFVRFTWKPLLGVHSLLVDEANIIGGIDPDFHRNDIIEAVQKGQFAEYELGVQLIPEEKEFAYEFDVLDPTKLWPEEVVPVEIIGKLTLNRLVDNFFAEEEQSSFDPATLVPGIDFTNDPVLQGRSFAYRDTDYHRLGTGNINEIPVNMPLKTAFTNNRDSYSKYRIDTDYIAHHKNHLAHNTPKTVPGSMGGFTTYPEEVSGIKTRELPSDSFYDFFSQARLFYNSLAPFEKRDLIDTFIYHLQHVKSQVIRQQNVEMWANVDRNMATKIAENIGCEPPKGTNVLVTNSSPALSMANTIFKPDTLKVAVLIGDEFNFPEVNNTLNYLQQNNVFIDIISEKLGTVIASDGEELMVDATFKMKLPELYDAIYIVGGKVTNNCRFNRHLKDYFRSAYDNYKPIAIASTASQLFKNNPHLTSPGVVVAHDRMFAHQFLDAIAKQRFWNRK